MYKYLILILFLVSQISCDRADEEPSGLAAAPQSFSYGLEFEMLPEVHQKVVDYYYPFDGNLDEWLRLNRDQRVKAALKYKAERGYEGDFEKIPCDTNPFLKDAQRALCNQLTPRLSHETRALELNGFVFHNKEDLKKFVDLLSEEFGEGFVQIHVVFPWRPLYGYAGWALKEHDRAMFARFEEEYALYLTDKTFLPAHNLWAHDFIEPMNSRHLEEALMREELSQKNEPIGKNLSPHQSYAGAILRTDPYPSGNLGIEIRLADQSYEQTIIRKNTIDRIWPVMVRIKKMFSNYEGRTGFLNLEKEIRLPRFEQDTADDFFADLFKYLGPFNDQKRASKLANKLFSKNSYKASVAVARVRDEDMRPWLFTLRPWAKDIPMNAAEKARILNLQQKYLVTFLDAIQDGVTKAAASANDDDIKKEVVKKLQIANGLFAHEAQLSKKIEEQIEAIINKKR